jgi:hypothetical protein
MTSAATLLDGREVEYTSAMGTRAGFDDCRIGPSEVDKSLNTFYDTIKANPTDASRLATSQRRSYRSGLAPRLGFTSPDSNTSENQSSNVKIYPGLKYPARAYRSPPPFALRSHSRTGLRQQMPKLRQTVVNRQARHKTWTHRRNRRQHKVERITSIHGSREFWRKPRRALERRVHKRQGMARRDSPHQRLLSHRPNDTVLSFGSQLNARFDGRA